VGESVAQGVALYKGRTRSRADALV